jgi:signal transduction histidine kinase
MTSGQNEEQSNKMRKRFRYALLSIPVVTILAQVSLGSWQARTLKTLQDRVKSVIDVTLELDHQMGFGGLVHNFKNAVLRPGEPEYIYSAERNADTALDLITQLEKSAFDLGIVFALTETRKTVSQYRAGLEDIKNREQLQLSIVALDDAIRIDDSPALSEFRQFQNLVTVKLQKEMARNLIRTQVTTIVITILALLGGYIVFSLAQSEQRRLNKRDHTAQKRLLEQSKIHASNLVRVNESLQQFAGIAAHDLRAPTRQVLAFAELALDDDHGAEEHSEFLRAIKTSAVRMRNMVETLLGFAQKGFRNPERKLIRPTEIVAITSAEKQKSDTIINLSDLPYLYADRELIERVFSNLISNAEKYGPEDTACEINIDGWEADDRTYISVTDNGPGIDPAYADIIFRPFKRIGHTEAQGEGIGLSLVQSIINAHWGEIWLDTEYRDGGARFVFWLPSQKLLPDSETENAAV